MKTLLKWMIWGYHHFRKLPSFVLKLGWFGSFFLLGGGRKEKGNTFFAESIRIGGFPDRLRIGGLGLVVFFSSICFVVFLFLPKFWEKIQYPSSAKQKTIQIGWWLSRIGDSFETKTAHTRFKERDLRSRLGWDPKWKDARRKKWERRSWTTGKIRFFRWEVQKDIPYSYHPCMVYLLHLADFYGKSRY